MPHTSPEASLLKSTAGFGCIFAFDTTPYTGNFFCVQAMEDCVFSKFNSSNMENSAIIASSGVILPAGLSIAADFTEITLATGKAIIYKH